MKKIFSFKNILPIIAVAILVLLDQITKYFTIIKLKDKSSFVLLKDIFEFTYVENTGAAFGIFKGAIPYFIIVTSILLIIVCVAYIKLPQTKKMQPLRIICVLIAAGGIGNLIDRIFRGFVVDMIYFKPINFPVVNVADCYVTVAEILLITLIIFYYKDEDFEDFHIFKKSKSKNTYVSPFSEDDSNDATTVAETSETATEAAVAAEAITSSDEIISSDEKA